MQNNSSDAYNIGRFVSSSGEVPLSCSMDSFYQSPDFSQFMTNSGPMENDDCDLLKGLDGYLFFQKVVCSDRKEGRRAADNCVSKLVKNLYTVDCTLVRDKIARLVELSVECPYEDSRNIFLNFLKEYQKEFQDRNLVVPRYCPAVTYYFPPEPLIAIDTDSENVREIFIEQFLSTGRVTHLARIMALHPEFYYKYQACKEYLMGNDDLSLSLPFHIKHFVALMAAARWKNTYLVKQQERILLENGSMNEYEWLRGFTNLPKKISLLLEFNAKMAETPWKLNDNDFLALVSGDDSWTVSELVQIFLILATYRGLAGFISATGINEELEYESIPVKFSASQNKIIEDKNKGMLDKMRLKLHNRSISGSPSEPVSPNEKGDKLALFHASAQIDIVQPNMSINYSNWTPQLEKKYGSHYHITYSDFNFKDAKPLSIQEYNWSTNGYNEVANYYSREMADILDDAFTFTMSFTYSSFCNEKSVDTTQFRIAIWNYTHRLLGIFHDDYDYELVNIWLLQPLKQYIKKIVCHPYTITDADIIKVGFLLPTEKVHVAFIVMEARREAELICVLRLVTKYTQSIHNVLSHSKSTEDTSNSSDSKGLGKKRNDKKTHKPDMFFHI